MKLLTIPLLIFILNSCNNKSSTKTESEMITTKVSQKVGDSIEIGFYDNFEKLQKFELETATKQDFDELKTNNTFLQTKIETDKKNFYLEIANKKVKFKKYDEDSTDDHNGSEYLGYSPNLDLFAVQNNSVADHLGFADIELINKTNAFKYKIVSLGDWSGSIPLASPNNQFLVYFQNPEYESPTLSIAILKVNNQNNPKSFLKEYASCFVDNDFSIEEIRWKSDHNFIIKAYKSDNDDSGKEVKNYSYFSAKFN